MFSDLDSHSFPGWSAFFPPEKLLPKAASGTSPLTMFHSFGALSSLFILSLNFYSVVGVPVDLNITNVPALYVPHVQPRADKVLLRIMPLGASITQGLETGLDEALHEGYRRHLRDQLRYWGYEVNMVGSRVNGNFKDNQHEGHPGYQISQINALSKNSYTTRKPNLVLINAGTNDCVQADDRNFTPLPGGIEFVQGSKDRIRSMIEGSWRFVFVYWPWC